MKNEKIFTFRKARGFSDGKYTSTRIFEMVFELFQKGDIPAKERPPN